MESGSILSRKGLTRIIESSIWPYTEQYQKSHHVPESIAQTLLELKDFVVVVFLKLLLNSQGIFSSAK